MGIRTYHGNAVREGTWKPIVKPADWTEIQSILDDPDRARNPRGVAARYLLSGIAECGVCGAWMRPLTNRGRATYVCAGRVPTAGKGHVARARPPLDAMVVQAVVQRMSRPDVLGLLLPKQEDNSGAAQAARELADLEAQLAQYEESAAKPNGVSATSFARIEARLVPQIEDARRRATPRGVPAVVLDMAGPDASARWDGLPLERQRQVVRALLRVVVHRSPRRGARGFDASTVELVWR
jgi:site-specific DNA recombinase